jgi:O-methyltransferase involved in polyketide biosynthesis
VAIRTCIIDEFIRFAVNAGLDTRPYRMRLPDCLTWIEVDYARVIDFKEKRLSGETPACRLERVEPDLADRAARTALFAKVAAGAWKALVLTEGVVPYPSVDYFF